MSKTLGLNIVVGNSVVTLILPEAESRTLVDGFKKKSLLPIIGGRTVDGQDWAFKSDDLKGMCTFDCEAVKKQQEVQQPFLSQRWSGV